MCPIDHDNTRWTPDLENTPREKLFYALTMFPYPSGYGLHVGHASIYTINDVMARWKRMQWFTVLNPIGFDSFWLPTENYAMKLGKPAYEVTDENIATFVKQLDALDMSFDMQRMLATSHPDYYKWTQWIFSELFKAWLMYRDELWVNWCPDCQTVLANDQVVEWKCERCKAEIIQKKMPQWFIKITDYADRLIEDLDDINWPEETKRSQINWIGKSVGAEIDFAVWETTVTVFTTRPDTIYWVTALVLAPENTLLDDHLSGDDKNSVESYRKETMAKTAVQRQVDSKEKTWVDSGLKAVHPLSGDLIPVRYADYVLPDYATGSVMMVPAHDERDYEFAGKFGITIAPVIKGNDIKKMYIELPWWNIIPFATTWYTQDKFDNLHGYYIWEWILIHSQEFNWLPHTEAKTAIIAHLEEKWVGRSKTTYKLRDRSVSRQRYWGSPIPVFYKEYNKSVSEIFVAIWDATPQSQKPMITRESVAVIVYDTDQEKYIFLNWKHNWEVWPVHWWVEEWQSLEDAVVAEIKEETGYESIGKIESLDHLCRFQRYAPHKELNRNGYAHLYYAEVSWSRWKQSDEDDWVIEVVALEKSLVLESISQDDLMQYFWQSFSNRKDGTSLWEKEKIMIPHLIPEDQLPVELPLDVENYKPKGKSPLEEHPTFPTWTAPDGKTYRRECDTLDTFMCSSFYFLRYPDVGNDQELIGRELANKMLPVDLYSWGKEHTVGHLLYSRFIHKFLFDQGYVDSKEPFSQLIHQGMIQGEDGRKMSKRWGNVIDPLDVIKVYGSDAVRTYIMFMGPYDQDKPWNDGALKWVKKFLDRLEGLLAFDREWDANATENVLSEYHKTVAWVTDDLGKFKFNTVVSKFMILVNTMYANKVAPTEVLEWFTLLIAPFATQLAEKLWKELWHDDDVHFAPWPVADESKMVTSLVNLPVQVNGKMRGSIDIAPWSDEETVLAAAQNQENVAKHIDGKPLRKVIYVQDKILNIIV